MRSHGGNILTGGNKPTGKGGKLPHRDNDITERDTGYTDLFYIWIGYLNTGLKQMIIDINMAFRAGYESGVEGSERSECGYYQR